jgi:hypothetical protein
VLRALPGEAAEGARDADSSAGGAEAQPAARVTRTRKEDAWWRVMRRN